MERLGPFGPAPLLAVGVSGGPHSLALAILASEWVAVRGGRVLALVADHGLRPGSAAEARAVLAQLGGLGIAVRLLPLELSPGPGLHERAREARLAALLAAAGAEGAPWLLLGHHRADQAETVAFRALRGSGEAGLAGMAPARPAVEALVLRPLLGVAPGRIEAFLAARRLDPLRDPSNDDPRFARARLRLALGDPGGEGPGIAALAAAGEGFAARRARMRAAMAERLAGAAEFREEGWARLDRAALGRDAVAEAALSALIRALGGGVHPPARAAVSALLARGGGSLGGALWRGGLVLREPARCALPVPARAGVMWDGRWRVLSAPGGTMVGARGAGPRIEGLPSLVAAGLPVLRNAAGEIIAAPGREGGWAVEFSPISGPLA
ncbi:tRNA lysidine(34) synthetase TilS [Muricoccus pecuniae]|uniref:tRNA(Ile)-lysidine synthase n=1 Tax=Muricoccus pecuniae TaxID=693023 RepID=A0A840YKR4_9PROT|nr:tRNA lysidine(34) synthetase TilS [Roseomonas pecuniae]MBB5694834.1 tRNA(Ile)-lysidine synthase [Roseomonas pecuniae]